MAAKKKASFNLGAFIKGVERPTRIVTLCTDVNVREELDALMREIDALSPVEDESLMGDGRRDEIVEKIRAISDDTSSWTKFTVKAPTRDGRVYSTLNLIDSGDGGEPDDTENARPDGVGADGVSGATLRAEARLIADCLVAIDGNPVKLSFDDAAEMQHEWPDDLIQEIVNAIREFRSDINSVPFSQRLSQTLKTPSRTE